MTSTESICLQFDVAKRNLLDLHHPCLTSAEVEAIIAAFINYQFWGCDAETQIIQEINLTPYIHTSDFHTPWFWLNNTVVTEKDADYQSSLEAYQRLLHSEGGFQNAVNRNPHTNECGGKAAFTESDADEIISAFINRVMAF